MENTIQFFAEVREVKSKKLITNDIEYTVKLNTDSEFALDLGKLPADTLLKVTIEPSNDTR